MTGEQRAALWIVAGMATVAIGDNLVPVLAREMGLWQMLVYRAVLSLGVAASYALLAGGIARLWPTSPARVAVRSALVVTALMAYFAALPAVPIALAAAGLFTSPIWILLVSALVLRERIGPFRIAAVTVGFIGVLMVLGVGRVPVAPMALAPLSSGLFYGLAVIWTRERCAAEDSLCLAAWQQATFLAAGLGGLALLPLLGVTLAGIEGTEFMTRGVEPVGRAVWGVLGLSALSSIVGAAFLVTGYRSGRASIVGLFDYSFLVWAPLLGWLMRGEGFGGQTAAGMGLIALAGVLASRAAAR